MTDENFKEKRLIFFCIIGAVILYGIYQFFWNQKIKRDGIYSKGFVVNSESTKGGIIITVGYIYRNKEYEARLSSDLGKGAIGRQYFIQFLRSNPKAIVFHKDRPVPPCLINIEAPKEGWEKIPACP